MSAAGMHRAAFVTLAAFFALAAPSAAEAKRVALVVGINVYDNLAPGQQLQKARNDARAVAATFKETGFQVILAEDAGRVAFLRAWQRFLDTVAPGDVTALYFSGHGVEINGSNYLLVRDIPEVADGEEVLKNSGVRLQALMERLKEQKPQVSIFIIDACRNSPYVNQGGKRGVIASARGLRPEEPPKGTLIMMSAGAGQEALDSLSTTDPNPNSVYTRTLLPLLREPGLEITDLAKRLRGNVEALAATVRHEQRPAFYHELSGDFYLVAKPEAPTVVVASAPAASEVSAAWGATKDTTSPAVLEAFIKQFGATVYATMARARLDELKRTQVATVVPPAVPPKASAPVTSVAPGSAPAEVRPPAAAAPALVVPNPESRRPPSVYEAAQEWAKTRETTNPTVLEAFLGQYGDTIYGPMARDRLRDLKNTQVAVVAPPATASQARDATAPAVVAPPAPTPVPPALTPAVGVFPASRSTTPLTTAEEFALKPRDSFTECARCPEMVVVPPGGYTMGSPPAEEGRTAAEGPQNAVTFASAFAVGKYAVTFEEWEACVVGGGCNSYRPGGGEGRPSSRYPVVNVSWDDAEAYVAWLTKSTGKAYRLLSEAEREYVARAGTTTPFWWGPSISTEQANYDGSVTYGGGKRGEYRQKTLPVDTFAPNSFGLYQVHGNVNEWVADCWRNTYRETTIGAAAGTTESCGRRVLRGGSWYDGPQLLRAAARLGFYPGHRSNKIGFRVARSL
jgi:formylglycine-generating enzyme required for sulfatase activity